MTKRAVYESTGWHISRQPANSWNKVFSVHLSEYFDMIDVTVPSLMLSYNLTNSDTGELRQIQMNHLRKNGTLVSAQWCPLPS